MGSDADKGPMTSSTCGVSISCPSEGRNGGDRAGGDVAAGYGCASNCGLRSEVVGRAGTEEEALEWLAVPME